MCEKLISTPSMQQVGAEYADKPATSCVAFTYASDAYWRCMVRARSMSAQYPVGTCKMGVKGDKSAVVDDKLRYDT